MFFGYILDKYLPFGVPKAFAWVDWTYGNKQSIKLSRMERMWMHHKQTSSRVERPIGCDRFSICFTILYHTFNFLYICC